MGANAQTSVPVFTAGQVLTAQQQTEINTGIPVFATTVTRDAAFGGTGEKTLAEGQFAYIEATNTTQYYDGSAWQTVGINPGLVCVKAETAFSAASSVTVDNVFTSTYTNYILNVRYTTSTTNNLLYRNRVGGVSAATNYNWQELQASSTTVTGARTTGATTVLIGLPSNGSFMSSSSVFITGPQLAEATTFAVSNADASGALTTPILYLNYGNHSTATAYDGFEILVSSGTTTGSYSVYGYSKTV
jgi:hypothetical protein